MGKRWTNQSFIDKASIIHNGKYDYSKTSFTRLRDSIAIICPEHGLFHQNAGSHLNGVGCAECSGCAKHTTDWFIKEANRVHNGIYDYSNSTFDGMHKSIEIKCSIHGAFMQIARNHLRGQGCRFCWEDRRGEDLFLSTEKFIKNAKDCHGGKYDYSLTEYKSAREDVKIICKKHGVFTQKAYLHSQGRGCQKCRKEKVIAVHINNPTGWSLTNWERAGNKSKSFDGFKVYLILCADLDTHEYFIKIGRTYTNINKRAAMFPYKWKHVMSVNGDASKIFKFESFVKRSLRQYKMKPVKSFQGMYECFSISALNEAMNLFEESNLTIIV